MTPDEKREAFRRWMVGKGLSPFAVSKLAGISSGTIYNFLSGTSDSLSTTVLVKIAEATGARVDDILTGDVALPHLIAVTHRIGAGGRMFRVEGEEIGVEAPPGLAAGPHIEGALIDGDQMFPLPHGWVAFYDTRPLPAAELVGKIALARYSGGGDRFYLRTIRRGTEPGLFTLQAFNGALTEDVEIETAMAVVSLAAPAIKRAD